MTHGTSVRLGQLLSGRSNLLLILHGGEGQILNLEFVGTGSLILRVKIIRKLNNSRFKI